MAPEIDAHEDHHGHLYVRRGRYPSVDGQAVKLGKPAASLAHGIYLVPQEPMLFPNMTVLENILMGFNENESELKKRLAGCMRN